MSIVRHSAWLVSRNRFTTGAAGLAVALATLAPIAISRANGLAVVTSTVDRLINESGSAKSDGNMALAYALLHDVVRIAPDNSQARWQLGQVKVQGEWLTIEEAQRRAAADPRQTKYQEHKDEVSNNPDDQLALARWCRKNKLDDEARVHLASVLSVDPNNKTALRGIGKQWRDGQLVSAGEVKANRQQASSTKRSLRQWESAVAGWMRALSDKNEASPTAVIDEIQAIDDVAAIAAFERVTLNNRISPNEKNPAAKRLSLAFLAALRDIQDEKATNSLSRYAVLSPFGDVRSEAIAELQFRPLTDFVPDLLDALNAPIKTFYRVQTDPTGSVRYQHEAYQEGPFADKAYRTTRTIYRPSSPFGVMANVNAAASQPNVLVNAINTPARGVSRVGASRSALGYEQEIVAGEQRVQALNQQAAARNERVVAVLTGVSDQTYGNDPRAWWNWWQDYTDYYREGDRPVYATVENSNEYIIPPTQAPRSECFVAGTPVWTKTGQKPIDSLTPGDLVLAQNVDTGEVAYRPVLLRTLRPAGPTLELTTGGEKIFSTRGHPLWVDGVGWRMAKELEDGALLHSLSGMTRIENIRPAADAETYNLVVADFNTYFVGESGILVHDNTPRRPTQAVVPGLTAD